MGRMNDCRCQWCKTVGYFEVVPDEGERWWQIQCMKCKARGPVADSPQNAESLFLNPEPDETER